MAKEDARFFKTGLGSGFNPGEAVSPSGAAMGYQMASSDHKEDQLAADRGKALIAITMDIEMSMHHPTWSQMEWNYEKGLLDRASIAYARDWTIDNRAVFDFTTHPSVSNVVDPGLETLEMVLETIRNAGDRMAIVDLGVIAKRARQQAHAGT